MSKVNEDTTLENTKKEAKNKIDQFIYKIIDFLGLTSGVGLVGIGGYWFMYSLLQYIIKSPVGIYQQTVHENYFNQAQIGIVIVALGILIMEIKKIEIKKITDK